MVGTMKDQLRESKPGRRQHDRAFKEDLIAQSLVPGASVAAIAMKGGINANLLFKWRREQARVKVGPTRFSPGATLLPVHAIGDFEASYGTQPAVPVSQPASRSARSSAIELEIAGGQLRLRGETL